MKRELKKYAGLLLFIVIVLAPSVMLKIGDLGWERSAIFTAIYFFVVVVPAMKILPYIK